MTKLNIWEKIAINENKEATHIKRNVFGNIVFIKIYQNGLVDEVETLRYNDLFQSIKIGETVSIKKLKGDQKW